MFCQPLNMPVVCGAGGEGGILLTAEGAENAAGTVRTEERRHDPNSLCALCVYPLCAFAGSASWVAGERKRNAAAPRFRSKQRAHIMTYGSVTAAFADNIPPICVFAPLHLPWNYRLDH